MDKIAQQPAPPLPWPQVPPASPDQISAGRNQALIGALYTLLGTGAVGATATGLSGLLKTRKSVPIPAAPTETSVPIPYPQAEETEKKSDFDILSKPWWKDQHVKTPLDAWWTVPLLTASAGTGLFGSSKLMEQLIKKRRQSQLDRELRDTGEQFNQSLLSQYKPETTHQLKIGSLYDVLEKKSSLADDASSQGISRPSNYAGLGVGTALTAGTLLAALAARGAYRRQEGKTQEDLLSKAIKQKAYLQSLRSPQPISLEPTLVPKKEQQESVVNA